MMDEWNGNRSQPGARPGVHHVESDAEHREARRRDRDAARKRHLDEALELGLEETFPGSDPVSITQPSGPDYIRRPPRS